MYSSTKPEVGTRVVAVAVAATAAAATSYYFFSGAGQAGMAVPQLVPFSQQSVLQNDGSRVSCFCKDGELVDTIYDDVHTLYEAFLRGVRVSNSGPCLGYKPSATEPFTWINYKTVLERAEHVGAGVIALGLSPGNSTYVGVYSQNKPEYVITDLGLWTYSMVGVPLYDTLGVDACNHIINQAEIHVCVCDTELKAKSLMRRHHETPTLRILVVMETISGECKDIATQSEIKLLHFSELEALGKANPQEKRPPKPEDSCIICYTSGTTGIPKGAILTHRGSIATSSACLDRTIKGGIDLTHNDVLVSYLPLAHSYERLLHGIMFMLGASIGFFQGDIRKLMEDIKELQPTLFPCVPRLLNRFYDKVTSGVNSSAVKRFLFGLALKSKEGELKKRIIRKDSFWDKVVFKSVQAALGGHVRLITTGSAPLSPTVLSFLRCVVGCPMIEGYGSTENHAVCTLQMVGDNSAGTVGPPLNCCAVKLVDIPEMNYHAKDNKGEICIKGSNVFNGYLKDQSKTDEAIDKNGWLHTGDIGQWTEEGTVKIIDRKKHIFKLAQGEYIAPEKVENVLIQCPLVAQMYIHGDSLKSCVVGVVVPDPEVFLPFASNKLQMKGTMEDLCQKAEVKNHLLSTLQELSKKAGLSSLEIVQDIYVHPELFSVENGMLTPTFKSKRNEIALVFKQKIQDMYDKLN